MRATRRLALVCLSLILLSGCAIGDGLPRRGDLLIEPGPARELGYVLNWASDLNVPRSHRIAAAEILGDVLVTVESDSNLVTAISLHDGSVRWRRIVGDANKRVFGVAREGDLIVVNTDARLYLLAAHDGDVTAIQNLGRVVAMKPTILPGLAIFGSIDGVVFAHDLGFGYTEWEYKLTQQILTPPVVDGDNIFVADGSGVYAMLTRYGELLWRGRTFDTISAAPAMDQAAVYVPSEDRALYALNRNTGRDRWDQPFRASQPITLPPTSFDLTVLQPLPGRGVVALDSVEGDVRWEIPHTALPITRSGEDVILATGTRLLRVDLETGRVGVQAPTRPLTDVLVGPDDSLILVSPGGRLLRMNPAR